MFTNNVYFFKNLPVEQKIRKRTDCFCTICSAIFALTLFILSFILFRRQNFYQANFPTNDAGKTCSYDYPNFPYVYFANPNDLSSGRQCVSSCPVAGQPLQCPKQSEKACIAMGGSQYSTKTSVNRLGAFCVPVNQRVADHMWNQPQIQIKNSILHSIDIILISLLLGLLLGLIFMVLVACLPNVMSSLVFVGAFLFLLFAGIYILAKPVIFFTPQFWNILLGIALIVAAFTFLAYLALYNRQLRIAQILLKHANLFLKADPLVFAYIPLFLILTFGLIVLIVWQYIAFGTANDTQLTKGQIFRTSSHNIPLQILNAIELVWGLQFLRDAFNYVVSGNSVEYYFRSQNNQYQSHCCRPFTRLITKNWGSVAGGSFLNAFFTIFDSISDLFKCDPKGSCAKCSSIYKSCCCCDYLFQLVRTDAYSYINLTGIPYCNAARQCQALCHNNQAFRGSQSCLRLYRTAAHIFLATLVAVISYLLLAGRGASYTNWFVLVLIVFGAYCICSYFIDIHADAAEGLMVSYLAERNCEGYNMEVCPPGLRVDLEKEYSAK